MCIFSNFIILTAQKPKKNQFKIMLKIFSAYFKLETRRIFAEDYNLHYLKLLDILAANLTLYRSH